jgi:hypothetical protein
MTSEHIPRQSGNWREREANLAYLYVDPPEKRDRGELLAGFLVAPFSKTKLTKAQQERVDRVVARLAMMRCAGALPDYAFAVIEGEDVQLMTLDRIPPEGAGQMPGIRSEGGWKVAPLAARVSKCT